MNKIIKRITSVGAAIGALAITAAPAFAQSLFDITDINPPSAGFTSFGSLITVGLTIIFIVAGLAVLIYLFYGAFVYLTAGDSEEQTGKARSMITNAVIGLIIMAAAWAIWQLVINLVPGLGELLGQDGA